jgi:ABC-type multidrug transport system ATPase subunit
LGSSGCGKTTLLSCVVGLRKLDSGNILVFGAEPGTKGSGIPGRKVGYMPQEIALYGEFSIKEVLQYYGRLYGMPKWEVEDNAKFLVTFLNLPPQTRRINSLRYAHYFKR